MPMPIFTRGHAVRTVNEWRGLARHYRVRSWQGAMRAFAMEHGKAIAILANDGALFFERSPMRSNGQQSLIRHELSADSVAWHDGAPRHD